MKRSKDEVVDLIKNKSTNLTIDDIQTLIGDETKATPELKSFLLSLGGKLITKAQTKSFDLPSPLKIGKYIDKDGDEYIAIGTDIKYVTCKSGYVAQYVSFIAFRQPEGNFEKYAIKHGVSNGSETLFQAWKMLKRNINDGMDDWKYTIERFKRKGEALDKMRTYEELFDGLNNEEIKEVEAEYNLNHKDYLLNEADLEALKY